MSAEKSLKDLLRRLCDLSVERAYDPFRDFEWPASLPDEGLWMSADLLSVHGTRYMDDLTEEQLWRLSRWELVNFFSFNVHGIRDLMLRVLACIHNAGYEATSEYFHHFLDEENKHMWFFAEFCNRYGGKIYVDKKMQFPTFPEEDIQTLLAFAKILISEEISDFYNVRMMEDSSLPPMVQKLNRVHHQDEVRHIAMGRRVVRAMYEAIAQKYPEQTRRGIESYLRRYMQFFVEALYNPSAYRDAGFDDPYGWRNRLINDPAREDFHNQVLRKTLHYFESRDILAQAAS
jgi:hypothetical protein